MAFTYFFRDMQTLDMIRENVLPSLRTRRYIDIWDAGCAMGPEPYSVAIVIRESMGYMQFRNVRIRATDIDQSNLFEQIIKKGEYSWEQVERIPTDILEKYFIDKKNGIFEVIEEIRNSVTFQKNDLLELNPPKSEFGLIICKNVLLHFTEKERIDVINMYHKALMEDGFLAIEQTQKLPNECEHLFEQVVPNAQLFRKI